MLKSALTLALVLPLAALAAQDQADNYRDAAEVSVTLSNFKFVPAKLHLAAGKPVILKLSNASSGGHDFGAPQFFAKAQISPNDAHFVHNGHVEVHAGQTASLALVPSPGSYRLSCDHPFHALFGMSGDIIVE